MIKNLKWILRIVGLVLALLLPAIAVPGELHPWARLVAVFAVVIAIYLGVRDRWGEKAPVWLGLASLVGLAAGSYFFVNASIWIIDSHGVKYFRGELKSEARAVIESEGITEEDYIFGSNPTEYGVRLVYEEDSLRRSRGRVVLWYNLFIFFSAFAIIGWIEYGTGGKGDAEEISDEDEESAEDPPADPEHPPSSSSSSSASQGDAGG